MKETWKEFFFEMIYAGVDMQFVKMNVLILLEIPMFFKGMSDGYTILFTIRVLS